MLAEIKCLTLTQPWATLVAIGAKRIETRSWSTNYRGWLAIHAAKGFPQGAKEQCWKMYFYNKLWEPTATRGHTWPVGALPRGASMRASPRTATNGKH